MSQVALNKNVVIAVGGASMSFTMTPDAYTSYINDVMPDDKLAPAYNLCMATVEPEDKEELEQVLKHPAVLMSVSSKLIKEYSGDLVVSVKK